MKWKAAFVADTSKELQYDLINKNKNMVHNMSTDILPDNFNQEDMELIETGQNSIEKLDKLIWRNLKKLYRSTKR
jgi:hypothetical protein